MTGSCDPQPQIDEAGAAIASEYAALYPLLVGLASRRFRVPPDEAAAVVHDVFVAYLRNHERVSDHRAWLIGATCNASRLYWRRQQRVASGETPELEEAPAGVTTIDLDRRIDAAQALQRLGTRCRELLRLRFLEGYAAAALAAHLGTTAGYARKLVYQCMGTLRRRMESQNGTLR